MVEGESDCHAGWTHRRLVLGLPGCQTWQPGWAPHFAGRSTYIWREPGPPDKDGQVPSTKMLEKVAADLPSAKVIHPPEGIKDLCDLHLAERGAFDAALRRLVHAAVPIRDVVIPKPKPSPVRVWRDSSRRADPLNRDHLDVEQAHAVPLDQLMVRLGFELKRRGYEFAMLCPFHEDRRPSLRINPAKGVWRCDPCDEGGDAIAFMQKWRGLSFPDAVRAVVG